MSDPYSSPEPLKPRRRWYQFSVEGLLVILAILAACAGTYYRATRPTRDDEQRAKVVEKLKALGDALQKHEDAYKKFPKVLEEKPANNPAS
ncbi:MAG TPA: hypothetical protein VHX65_06625 [Pirellulales bacterium]|jgi:hypothetical protein|nr:hypothetical protein [Pirellulales bacterium]